MNSKNVFLTFDIEDWCDGNFHSLKGGDYGVSNIVGETDRLLDICNAMGVKCTCFILASVATKHPDIVRKFYNAGHEIASHGSSHRLVYEMTPDEFYKDVKLSVDILTDITGAPVYGFRAPSWSVKKDNLRWFYQSLDELGFIYSSSVYPGQTYLYGIPDAPAFPHVVCVSEGRKMVEIPNPVCSILGKKIGYAGGFYLRLFPYWFIKRQMNKNKNDFFIYLHPREINPAQAKMKLNFMESLIAYYGVERCEAKLKRIVESQKDFFKKIMKDYAAEKLNTEVV